MKTKLLTLIAALAICTTATAQTASTAITIKAPDMAATLQKLDKGTYNITVTGQIDPKQLRWEGHKMHSEWRIGDDVHINTLDLSQTTGLD